MTSPSPPPPGGTAPRQTAAIERHTRPRLSPPQPFLITTSISDRYSAVHGFNARMPSPPRVPIPTPLFDSRVPTPLQYASTCTLPAQGPEPTILAPPAALDWDYSRRREPQAILPHLYLGPLAAAKDPALVRSHGFTLLLGLRARNWFQEAAMNSVARVAASLDDVACEVLVTDSKQELIRSFDGIVGIVNDHVRDRCSQGEASSSSSSQHRPPRVLLFCENGNERSAVAAAAYLMRVLEGTDHAAAMHMIQLQRFCANFDEGYRRLLQGYWDLVRAERQVASSSSSVGSGGAGDGDEAKGGSMLAAAAVVVGAKRGRSDEMEVDVGEGAAGMDMDVDVDDGDLVRFRGRRFMPYVERTA